MISQEEEDNYSFGFIPEDCFDLILEYTPSSIHFRLATVSKVWREKMFNSQVFLSSKHTIVMKNDLQKPKSMNEYIQEIPKESFNNIREIVGLLNEFVVLFQLFNFDINCVENFEKLEIEKLNFIVVCGIDLSFEKMTGKFLNWDSCIQDFDNIQHDIIIDKHCCIKLKVRF
eukprot:gene6881-11043_t